MHVGTIVMLILGGVLSTFMCIFPLYKVVTRLIRKDFRTDENFEKADKTFILYIGILACFVAGYFLISSFVDKLGGYQSYTHCGREVEGVVKGVKRVTVTKGYTYRHKIGYNVQGKTYTTMIDRGFPYDKGEKLRVFYLTETPSSAKVYDFSNGPYLLYLLLSWGIAFISTGFSLGLFKYVKVRMESS